MTVTLPDWLCSFFTTKFSLTVSLTHNQKLLRLVCKLMVSPKNLFSSSRNSPCIPKHIECSFLNYSGWQPHHYTVI